LLHFGIGVILEDLEEILPHWNPDKIVGDAVIWNDGMETALNGLDDLSEDGSSRELMITVCSP
jgi:hypothetical protein